MSNRPARQSRRGQIFAGLASPLPALARALTAPARSTPARLALAAAVAITALLAAGPAAHAQGGIPTVVSVAPSLFVENGQPIRITITGSGLAAVSDVLVSPPVPQRGFEVISDAALVVTFPAAIAPGVYDLVLASAAGISLPGTAVFTVRAAAAPTPPPDSGPGVLPQVSFAPIGTSSAASASSAAAAPGSARPTGGQVVVGGGTDHNPLNTPAFVFAFGIIVGGIAFALWGTRGSNRTGRRRDVVAQILRRPVVRLHLGRVCPSCGRLHLAVATRRDLWKAGQYCSPGCLAAAVDAAATIQRSGARLRRVTRYPELERQLEGVFAAEAKLMRTPAVLFADTLLTDPTVYRPLHAAAAALALAAPTERGAPAERTQLTEPAEPAAPEKDVATLLGAPNLNAAAKLAATLAREGAPRPHRDAGTSDQDMPAPDPGHGPAADGGTSDVDVPAPDPGHGEAVAV